jgi:hypothetical protein
MTHYIATYDTELPGDHKFGAEVPSCLKACERIVEMHRKQEANGYRDLLDDPLFEIASHTWSHRMLRDQPFCGKATTPEGIREELIRGKSSIEDVFQRECVGFRSGCGFVNGLRGAPEVLAVVQEAGYRYASTQLWGPDYSLPAPLAQAYTYEEDGYPNIIEFPGHGWQENLLKGSNRIIGMESLRLLYFPPLFPPEVIPDHFVQTAREEFEVNNKYFMERAAREGLEYVSLIWHPWSLGLFDPEMEMLDLTFSHAKALGLEAVTYAGLADKQ